MISPDRLADTSREADRILQLEAELRKRNIRAPDELTDEERAGAPIPPWKRDWGPGPAINKWSWDRMCADYERDLAEWRRERAPYMPMFIDFGDGLEKVERDWTGRLKITKVQP